MGILSLRNCSSKDEACLFIFTWVAVHIKKPVAMLDKKKMMRNVSRKVVSGCFYSGLLLGQGVLHC